MAKYIKTLRGDTFDLLALLNYDNDKLASEIIRANPEHCDTLIFDAGVRLLIPDVEEKRPETLPPWRRDV